MAKADMEDDRMEGYPVEDDPMADEPWENDGGPLPDLPTREQQESNTTIHDDNRDLQDDDDDPVVREIEVYVNRISNPGASADDSEAAGASIYLLQYPLRPIYRPYGDQGRLLKIRHRPHQKTLQMQYQLNMESDHFDPQRRDEILQKQMAATGESKNANSLGNDTCMTTHLLNSMSSNITAKSSYGLGLLQGNRLYITPLSSVLQFRPDFAHVDEEENEAQKRAEDHLAIENSKSPANDAESSSDKAKTPAAKKEKKAPAGSGKKSAASGTQTPSATQQASVGHAGPPPTIPPESEWHRYTPSRVRDALLGEPWVDVGAFYDPDSPESHEIIQLLTSFEVPISKSEAGPPPASYDNMIDRMVAEASRNAEEDDR